MNKEEELYLPYVRAALQAQAYPADAVALIMESKWVENVVGDSWRNHVPLELAQSHFQRRWLAGPMRCYWMWRPGMELADLPQDVTARAELTMKRKLIQGGVSIKLAEIHCPRCGRYWHDPEDNVAREELCNACKKAQPPLSDKLKKPSR